MGKIAFTTFVTSDDWYEYRAKPLMASVKYFHPDIPFKIFTPEESKALRDKCTYLPELPSRQLCGLV